MKLALTFSLLNIGRFGIMKLAFIKFLYIAGALTLFLFIFSTHSQFPQFSLFQFPCNKFRNNISYDKRLRHLKKNNNELDFLNGVIENSLNHSIFKYCSFSLGLGEMLFGLHTVSNFMVQFT